MYIRYYLDHSPELGPISERVKHSSLTQKMIIHLGKAFRSEGEICPDDMVPVIAPDHRGQKRIFPMIWGFHAEGIRNPISTVAIEIAKDKSSFKESWEKHRCVIPAAYLFEWSRIQSGNRILTDDKYVIQPRGMTSTWVAGFYRIEEGYMGFRYPVFTILMTRAVPDLRQFQKRMPLIIRKEDIESWICPEKVPEKLEPVTDLIVEKVVY